MRLTQRAPDWWESARFQAVSLAGSWFCQSGVVSSHPPAGNASRWANFGELIRKWFMNFFEVSGIPSEYGVLLLTLCLILALSPYFSGVDFGIIKIPRFK